jgi:hypothetical protein
MDELTRYFIATSNGRLTYLIHDQERKQQTDSQETEANKSQSDTIRIETPMNKNKSDSSEEQGEAEADTDFENFVNRFKQKLCEPKFALEFAGFIVLSIYAGFTGAMYCSNRDAANAAKESADTLKIQNRPWINVPESIEPDQLTPVFPGSSWAFKFTLKNLGQYPAVVMQPAVILTDIDKDEIPHWERIPEYHDLCSAPSPRRPVPVFREIPKILEGIQMG